MKKFTYKDWYNGDLTLKYAKSIFIDGRVPRLVSWDEFNKADVKKIKEKQEELFKKIVKTNLGKFKNHFSERYKKSSIKDELIERERQEFANILNATIPNKTKIVSKHLKILFKRDDLLEIQAYYKDVILGGQDYGYDFVQSPKDKSQYDSKILSQAYALVFFNYLEWLIESFKETNDALDTSKDKTKFLWFQVGLLFANGEMNRLIEESKCENTPNFSAISRKLENMNFRPYISESYYSKNNRKNIFLSKPKVSYLEKYCKENNIPIVESFKAYVKKHK
jgi:hypothetical protein